MSNPLFNMDKQVKDLIISYLEWEKNQPKDHHEIDTGEYKIVIDGVEVNIPEEEDIIASLEEEAIVCIKLNRDTEAEDESERNTTYFIVDKNRPFAKLGNAGSVYYDPETTILEEVSFKVWR